MNFDPIIRSIEKEINDIKLRHANELAPYELILKEAINLSLKTTSESDIIMGVRWHKNQSSSKLERIGASVGKTFVPARNGEQGHSDFDNMPIYRKIKPCIMRGGTVFKYIDNLKNCKDYNGDVMVKIPKFYYRVDNTGEYTDLFISEKPFSGSRVSPMHDRKSQPEKAYIGAFTSNATYSSESNCDPLVNETISDFRKGHAEKGHGYSTWDFATRQTIHMLYLVEVADLDSVTAVGYGNINSGNINKTGVCNDMMFHSGMVGEDNKNKTSKGVRYRWIENLWGNVYQFVDGILFDNSKIYICTDPDKFNNTISDDYIKLSYCKASSDGRIKNFGFDAKYPWALCPSEVYDDDERKYVCDYYWYNAGLRILLSGGRCYNGSSAGLFFFDCINSPSSAPWNFSSRLSYTG